MKVYAKTDEKGRLLALLSEAFLPDTTGWELVDEGEGDRYVHAQGHYLDGPIVTPEGVARYQVVAGKVKERTAEEIQADIDAIPPPPPDPLQVTQKAATVMFQVLAQADVVTPAQALMHQALFPLWADRLGTTAVTGEYLRHEEGLYRVQQGHPIQAHQPPSVHTAALYTRINAPGDVQAWVQGQSYAKGVEVTHNGGVWLSGVDNNTYEPGGEGIHDYIWKRVRDA